MSSPDLSLIICTLNEGAAIRGVITEIQGYLEGVDYEIVVLDDDSKDQTQAEVLALAAHDPRVRLVVRKGERGLSSAAIRGWDHARGRILGIMDGDGQHEPTAVRGLYDLMVAKDLDLASASRYANNGTSGLSLYRGAISRAGTFMAQMVLRAPLSDPLSGLFMMTRDYYLSARPNLTGVGFKILVDIVASAPRKPKFGEVCATLRTRQGGESKLDIRVVIDLVALLVEKMTRGVIPARFFMFAGVGVTGLVVHMAILSALYKGANVPFDYAMAAAILISMVWNFWVNNLLTFRDKRLSGWGMVQGFFIFALACSLGAVISQLVGSGLERLNVHWFLAGAAGPLAGGVWNYVAASKLAWGRTGDVSSPKPSANGAKAAVGAPNNGVSVTEHLPDNRPTDSI